MRERLTTALFVLLVAATALQTWLFVTRSQSTTVVPIVLPYRVEDLGAPPSPPVSPLPAPSTAPAGPLMTTDDLVRGLLALSDQADASLTLSPAQKQQLIPLVREAASRKERLHMLRKKEETLQQSLAEKGVAILQVLTPQQRDALLSNRDETERLLRNLPDLQTRLSSQPTPAPAPR